MSSKCIRDTVNKVKTKYQESDPYRLAAAMHIIVKKLPLGTDPNCCKGFCMRECRKTCIVINSDLPEIIQQIILIHEIEHALLHQKTLQIKCFHDFELFDGVSQCEYEANCFAADYLLEDEEQGVKELILVAQETTLYGKDLYGEKSLPKLLRELCKISGIRWIRILYCYPEEITDELIQVMKEEPKICHYLDLPIQHANDTILKRMGRRTSKQELIDIVQKLRKEIPDICLRTTLITGFPGETQEQHEEVMEFIDTLEFDRLGAFTYSPEEDTPAATFEDQIDETVKEDRQADIMELQQEIAFDKAEDMIGREVLVMIEGKVADENAYVGRTYRDAPNVDGLIFINTDVELISGDFAKVKVTGALDYDLIGELM